MRHPLRGFLPFLDKDCLPDKKLQIALASQFFNRLTHRSRKCYSLSRKNAYHDHVFAILSRFEKQAIQRFKRFKFNEWVQRQRKRKVSQMHSDETLKDVEGSGEKEKEGVEIEDGTYQEDAFNEEMQLIDELGVDEEVIRLDFPSLPSDGKPKASAKKKKSRKHSFVIQDCHRLMMYLVDIESPSLIQHSPAQAYAWIKKLMNCEFSYQSFCLQFFRYQFVRLQSGYPSCYDRMDHDNFIHTPPTYSHIISNVKSKRSNQTQWTDAFDGDDILHQNIMMERNSILPLADAEIPKEGNALEEEKEALNDLLEMLKGEINAKGKAVENSGEEKFEGSTSVNVNVGDQTDKKIKKAEGHLNFFSRYTSLLKRLEKKYANNLHSKHTTYILAKQDLRILYDKCGGFHPRCSYCYSDYHHVGFSCPIFHFLYRQKILGSDMLQDGDANMDRCAGPSSMKVDEDNDPLDLILRGQIFESSSENDIELFRKGNEDDAYERSLERNPKHPSLKSDHFTYPRLNQKYRKMISFSPMVPYSLTRNIPFDESFFLCSDALNCLKAKIRPGMGSTEAFRLHVMREHSTLHDFTQMDDSINQKRFDKYTVNNKRLQILHKEAVSKNLINDQDWNWANSLSDKFLEFYVAIQELALERMQIANVPELIEKNSPTQLRLIGLLVKQFIIKRIKKEIESKRRHAKGRKVSSLKEFASMELPTAKRMKTSDVGMKIHEMKDGNELKSKNPNKNENKSKRKKGDKKNKNS